MNVAATFLCEQHHTHSVKYYQGLFGIIIDDLLVLANASIPLSYNFIWELISLLAAF